MRDARGQATIDYVALIAVLAILLAAAAAVASGGAPGVANAVLGQVRHALCIVTGQACAAERRLPCVVATERDARHVAVTIVVVRLDGDRYVLREKMSDGTVRLTLAHRGGAGFELGGGGRLDITRKGHRIGAEDELRGGIEGVVGYGEVYMAHNDHEADEILHALTHRIPLIGGGGPDPSERFVEAGTRGLGSFAAGGPAAGAALDGLAGMIGGARRDERTRQVTITLNVGSSGSALFNAFIAGSSLAFDREVTLSLTLDRNYKAVELGVNATGMLAGGAALPAVLAGPLGEKKLTAAAQHGDTNGRRWEIGARVDLDDPEIAAAWAAFRHDPRNTDAIRALAAQLRDRANLDVRTYALHSESGGAGAGLGVGLRLEGEINHTVDRARLLAAATRPPGGLWEQRSDCVAA